MRHFAPAWLIVVLPIFASALPAQSPQPAACSDSLGKSMSFLQGHWRGHSYSVSGRDTVLDGLMEVDSRPLFDHCSLQENWKASKDGQVLFTAKVVRAYDGPTHLWSVYYVDDHLNSQIYQGRRDTSRWSFFRTRMDKGVPVQVRLTWFPTESGYEQLIERSRDGGTNWVLGGYVRFKAEREGR
jgi:hypothetical protein